MKKKTLSTMLATLMLFIGSLKSQVANYNFIQTNTNFTNVSTGTLIGTVIQDDDINLVNLPFNFTFNGNQYSSVNVNSNGFISFVMPQASEYYPISNATQEVISAFGQDLLMGTVIMGQVSVGSNTISNVTNLNGVQVGDSIADWYFDFGGISPTITAISGNSIIVNVNASNTNVVDLFMKNGSIRVNTIGSAPNRIYEINYKNMTRYTVYDEVINFKIRLHETTNMIEVVYGNGTVGLSALGSEVGLKGNLANDFNSRLVNSSNTWSTSLNSISIFDVCAFSTTNFPNTGLTYQWTSTTCVQPTLTAQTSNSIVCAGSTATINVSGANNYLWSTGSINSVIVVTPNTTQTYTVIGFNGSCSDTTTIIQNVSAQPTLTAQTSNSIVCAGSTATINVSGANNYLWSTGSINSAIVVTPNTNQTYTVIGFIGSCSDTTTIVQNVSACTSINENLHSLENLTIYPNPFNDYIIVSPIENDDTLYEIYDLTGKTSIKGKLQDNSASKINVSELSDGVYFFKLSNKTKTITRKIIKN